MRVWILSWRTRPAKGRVAWGAGRAPANGQARRRGLSELQHLHAKPPWSTDIHLDFLGAKGSEKFTVERERSSEDAFRFGGGIAGAASLEKRLHALETRLSGPVKFVLGNHELEAGSVPRVRDAMRLVSGRSRFLKWLPAAGVMGLRRETALVLAEFNLQYRFTTLSLVPVTGDGQRLR